MRYLTQEEIKGALEDKFGKVIVHNLNVSVEVMELTSHPKKHKADKVSNHKEEAITEIAIGGHVDEIGTIKPIFIDATIKTKR